MLTGHGVPIGRVRGIEIRVHWSWVIIAALLAWSLAESLFGPRQGWSVGTRWTAAIVTTVLFFASVLGHELSHSLVAQRAGLRVRSITLFVFGGVSAISDPMPSARLEFAIAIAGPLASGLFAVVFGLAWLVTRSTGLAPALGYLALINAALGAFNLLPGFPLDGGRVLRSAVWGRTGSVRRATVVAARGGAVIGLGLIAIGALSIFVVGLVGGIWYALIGFFLLAASRSEEVAELTDELMAGVKVETLMRAPGAPVEASTTLRDFADSPASMQGRVHLVRRDGGSMVGLLSVTDLANRDPSHWAETRVDEVMVPVERLVTVTAGSEIREALRTMAQSGVHQLPVVDHDRIVGLLTQIDVEEFVRRRLEFASHASPPAPPATA
ncbi:MAG: site-2 protease family protein [Dehalococcoidia bacterium]